MFLAAAAPAVAQDAGADWSGEGALSAGNTTGNTETSDLGIALKLKRKGDLWSQSGEFAADYGETDGLETKNRLYGAAQVDRKLSDLWSLYGRGTAEKDEFSGFESRYFLGVGAAYVVLDGDTTSWTVQGGPGYKIDEVRATLTTPSTTEESLSFAAASRFKHQFNERVALSNDTNVVTADASTQIQNVLALTADIMGNLSARISYDVRHDTDPPAGFESTDTTTRFSLVYKID
jgi:putative salt-induced outer membrane protein